MIDVINNSANGGRGPTDAATISPTANRDDFNLYVDDFSPERIESTNTDLNHNDFINENSIFQIIDSNAKFAEMLEEYCSMGEFWN